jgi:hypothetical protein
MPIAVTAIVIVTGNVEAVTYVGAPPSLSMDSTQHRRLHIDDSAIALNAIFASRVCFIVIVRGTAP